MTENSAFRYRLWMTAKITLLLLIVVVIIGISHPVLLGGLILLMPLGFSWREIGQAIRGAVEPPEMVEQPEQVQYFWEAQARNAIILGLLGSVHYFLYQLSNPPSGRIMAIAAAAAMSFGIVFKTVTAAVVLALPVWRLKGRPVPENGRPAPASAGEPFFGWKSAGLRLAGPVLFIALMIWGVTSMSMQSSPEAVLSPAQILLNWPVVLLLGGGSLLLMWYLRPAGPGRTLHLVIAAASLIGLLRAGSTILQAFQAKSISNIGYGCSVILAVSFYSLLGLLLAGLPVADRWVMAGNWQERRLARLIGFGWPALILLALILIFLMIVIPMER